MSEQKRVCPGCLQEKEIEFGQVVCKDCRYNNRGTRMIQSAACVVGRKPSLDDYDGNGEEE